MNIKQIETFVRIVELGSFNAAAEALHASQSTVSARIKDLEHYLGVDLFDRSQHRARLTAKGRELHERAHQLIEFTHSLTRQIRAPLATTGTVHLGAVGVVVTTWLPDLVGRLRDRHPGVTLRIEASLTRQLVDRLREGKLDLAIVAGEFVDADLHVEPLGHDRFVWMARPGVVPPREVMSPADIASLPVLTFTEDSHHYPVVRRWFENAGVPFKPATSSNNMALLASLAERGLGVSLLPRHCYRAAIAAGRLVELDTAPDIEPVAFSLIYRRDRVSPLTSAVVEAACAASDLGQDSR